MRGYIEEIDTFQYVSIDRFITTDLMSGKEEAKKRREELNSSCESIREGMFKLKDELKDWKRVLDRKSVV